MQDLITVLKFCYNLLQTKLHFGSFTLTPFSILVAFSVISITCYAIQKIFD